ncbi:MAG: hypothetical protein ACSHYB_15155 [Roseibacillus sp.]
MKGVWGTILLVGAVLSLASCKQIKNSLSEFAGSGGSVPEALPDSESLAGAEGLPVVTSFQKVTPATIVSFTGAGDRISVVEFYSDT